MKHKEHVIRIAGEFTPLLNQIAREEFRKGPSDVIRSLLEKERFQRQLASGEAQRRSVNGGEGQ